MSVCAGTHGKVLYEDWKQKINHYKPQVKQFLSLCRLVNATGIHPQQHFRPEFVEILNRGQLTIGKNLSHFEIGCREPDYRGFV